LIFGEGRRVEHDLATAGRELAGLVVARAGRVAQTSDPTLPWAVLDGAGSRIDAVGVFLKDLLACGSGASSCRSYAFDLLRWFRFLAAVGVAWERASRAEVRDFVLWLRSSVNPARDRRCVGAPAPGSVNARTGKAHLRAGYAPATINHALSVLAAFYEFHRSCGSGRWSRPCRRSHAPAAGWTHTTIRWSRFGRTGVALTGRSSRIGCHGPCRTT
jgi:hypothetical protein